MKKLFENSLSAAVTIGCVVLLLGIAVKRFGLVSIHINPALWYFVVGILLAVVGGWLAKHEAPGGKIFATLGAILLLLGTLKAVWPKSAEASNTAQQEADRQMQLAIQNTIAPKRINPCDKTMDANKTPFFDRTTGEVRIWIEYDKEATRWHCYDRKGVNPVTREPYLEATIPIAKLIIQQDPLPTPQLISPPAPPVQVAAATPLPDAASLPIVPEATPLPIPESTPSADTTNAEVAENQEQPFENEALSLEREHQAMRYRRFFRRVQERQRNSYHTFRFRRHHRQYD